MGGGGYSHWIPVSKNTKESTDQFNQNFYLSHELHLSNIRILEKNKVIAMYLKNE